jgi:hypothetical protein
MYWGPKNESGSKCRDLCSFLASDLEIQEAVGNHHFLGSSENAVDPTRMEPHRKYF